jgi:hypothetical protein
MEGFVNGHTSSRHSSSRKRAIPQRFLGGLDDSEMEEPPTKPPPMRVIIPKKKKTSCMNQSTVRLEPRSYMSNVFSNTYQNPLSLQSTDCQQLGTSIGWSHGNLSSSFPTTQATSTQNYYQPNITSISQNNNRIDEFLSYNNRELSPMIHSSHDRDQSQSFTVKESILHHLNTSTNMSRNGTFSTNNNHINHQIEQKRNTNLYANVNTHVLSCCKHMEEASSGSCCNFPSVKLMLNHCEVPPPLRPREPEELLCRSDGSIKSSGGGSGVGGGDGAKIYMKCSEVNGTKCFTISNKSAVQSNSFSGFHTVPNQSHWHVGCQDSPVPTLMPITIDTPLNQSPKKKKKPTGYLNLLKFICLCVCVLGNYICCIEKRKEKSMLMKY